MFHVTCFDVSKNETYYRSRKPQYIEDHMKHCGKTFPRGNPDPLSDNKEIINFSLF
jgi:hypothetical protein